METNNKLMLGASFFSKYGFSKPIRYWNEKDNQFSIYYKIEGYDCIILVKPSTQVVPNNFNNSGSIDEMPPEIQVDEFSDTKILEEHHTGDFHIFVNSLGNHVATFHYEIEMIQFMSICGCPLQIR